MPDHIAGTAAVRRPRRARGLAAWPTAGSRLGRLDRPSDDCCRCRRCGPACPGAAGCAPGGRMPGTDDLFRGPGRTGSRQDRRRSRRDEPGGAPAVPGGCLRGGLAGRREAAKSLPVFLVVRRPKRPAHGLAGLGTEPSSGASDLLGVLPRPNRRRLVVSQREGRPGLAQGTGPRPEDWAPRLLPRTQRRAGPEQNPAAPAPGSISFLSQYPTRHHTRRWDVFFPASRWAGWAGPRSLRPGRAARDRALASPAAEVF